MNLPKGLAHSRYTLPIRHNASSASAVGRVSSLVYGVPAMDWVEFDVVDPTRTEAEETRSSSWLHRAISRVTVARRFRPICADILDAMFETEPQTKRWIKR